MGSRSFFCDYGAGTGAVSRIARSVLNKKGAGKVPARVGLTARIIIETWLLLFTYRAIWFGDKSSVFETPVGERPNVVIWS